LSSANASTGHFPLPDGVTQTYIPERAGPLIFLPEFGCTVIESSKAIPLDFIMPATQHVEKQNKTNHFHEHESIIMLVFLWS
jgi:hypothetical protein